MTARPDDNQVRSLVPRWRRSGGILHRWELRSSPLGEKPRGRDNPVHDLVKKWLEAPGIHTALEAVQAALVFGDTVAAFGPSEYLLRSDSGATDAVKSIARAVRYPPFIGASAAGSMPAAGSGLGNLINADIRALKLRVRDAPRDCLSWSDLALLYATIGQTKKAERAMEAGIASANGNRLVIRAACRLWLHLQKKNESLALIRRQELVRSDPWLLSAELAIATALGRTPRFVKEAKAVLGSLGDFPGFITELAGAVGQVELASGSSFKNAKKHLKQSLVAPNENTIAQAVWLQRQNSKAVTLPNNLLSRPGTFEANTMHAVEHGRWDIAQKFVSQWASDEPFSVRPFQMGSFLGLTVNEDLQFATEITRAGLTANPTDLMMRNNLVVAEALQGNLKAAHELLSHIPRSLDDVRLNCIVTATRGLVEFCAGNPDQGRSYYLTALHGMLSHPQLDREAAILVAYYLEQEAANGDVALATGLLELMDFKKLKRTSELYLDVKYVLERTRTRLSERIARLDATPERIQQFTLALK